MSRWFIRCPDCLSVGAVDADRAPAGVVCSVCNVLFEVMGRVSVDRLVKTELRCACDERCTCASGPSCSCKCGGANHGSGAVVVVQLDAGGIPHATPPDGKAPMRRDEWRAALERARANHPARDLAERKACGEFLSPDDFDRYMRGVYWQRKINHAAKLRTHRGRMAALAELAGPPPKVENPAPAWSAPVEGKPLERRAVAVGQQIGLLG